MSSLLSRLVLTTSALLALVSDAPAEMITLEVSALIDGRDRLIIGGDALQWHHIDFAAVGRHDGRNEPTTLTTTLDGVTQLDHIDWVPDWPLPPPDEIRFEAFSSTFMGLSPVLPSSEMSVTLELLDARGSVQLYQLPSAANGYVTVVEFDDNSWDASDFYRVRLTFATQSVPEPTSAFLTILGGSSLLLVARQRNRSAR